MLSIIYNVQPKHPQGDEHTHWLIALAEKIKEQCVSDSTLRVNRKFRDAWVIYTLRDRTSKRKIVTYADTGYLYVEAYSLQAVDTTNIYRPTFGEMEVHGKFKLNNTGISQAAEFAAREFEKPTLYSPGNYAKIQFSLDENKVDDVTVFLGGRISKYEYSEEYDITNLCLVGPNQLSKMVSIPHKLNGTINEERLREKFVIIKSDKAYCFHQTAYSSFYQEI